MIDDGNSRIETESACYDFRGVPGGAPFFVHFFRSFRLREPTRSVNKNHRKGEGRPSPKQLKQL